MSTSQSKLNLLLLSGSKAAGNLPENTQPGLLDWAEPWISDFFSLARISKQPILFVPYARPGGITEQEYFSKVQQRLREMEIAVTCAAANGINETILEQVCGIFIGGGHTPTLLHKLQSTDSIKPIGNAVQKGLPYMGSSAGTLISCPTIKTNNDMPGPANNIIDLNSLNLIPFQLNCHYMDDAMHDPKHQGETRDCRLREYCTFNPNCTVLGLYEGQALRVQGDSFSLWTSAQARGSKSPIFINQSRQEIDCSLNSKIDLTDFNLL